jgi:hypothetical protein
MSSKIKPARHFPSFCCKTPEISEHLDSADLLDRESAAQQQNQPKRIALHGPETQPAEHL